ncbi:DUF421 domain-containing protein [Oricola cellulosilytica]|uniref:DUF421 domain-containing protein n=1 Tax=Oricola cellulosilytica TaxID=1429082 RepID=A0A4R0PBC7_9HYPH|nr:YetF domain-containing protein [Oricola cellulosilytica]TCD14356.1 DUF421 domain-containing protein [Oricola cellulosilytica]
MPEILEVFLRSVVIVAVVIALARLNGLRSFSKMSAFDLVNTVAVGSILATAVTATGKSVFVGIAALVALFVTQGVIARLRGKFGFVVKVVDNEPLMIMEEGAILHDNLDRANLTTADLYAKLREANVLDVSRVRAVVLETTGDVSVLHASGEGQEVSPALLDDVRR